MAPLAYLLLPFTGLLAYFAGRTPRARFHGLQAIALGLAWPAALYGAAAVTPGATQLVFLLGAVLWLVFLGGTLMGRDPSLPGIRSLLQRASRDSPTGPERT